MWQICVKTKRDDCFYFTVIKHHNIDPEANPPKTDVMFYAVMGVQDEVSLIEIPDADEIGQK